MKLVNFNKEEIEEKINEVMWLCSEMLTVEW